MLEESIKGEDAARLGRAAGMAQQLLRWLHPLAATPAGRRLLCGLLWGPPLTGREAGGRSEQDAAPGADARQAALQMLNSACAVLGQSGAERVGGSPQRLGCRPRRAGRPSFVGADLRTRCLSPRAMESSCSGATRRCACASWPWLAGCSAAAWRQARCRAAAQLRQVLEAFLRRRPKAGT